MQRFCINRKITPALNIEAFFRLMNRLGLNRVEPRNDLPSGKVAGDLSHQQVRELMARYHIKILTVSAIYPFNRRSEEAWQLTESLLKEAQAIGAKSLALCPLSDGNEMPASETLSALHDLAPLFAFCGIHGLVEPLGFPQSSLRSALQAQALIHDARVPFELLIDTFHHHFYPQAADELSQVEVADIGLVHLSGVDDTRPNEQLAGAERIMLTPQGRLGTCEQVRALEARSYQGVYAFEPFASELAQWSKADIEHEIERSIVPVQRHCARKLLWVACAARDNFPNTGRRGRL